MKEEVLLRIFVALENAYFYRYLDKGLDEKDNPFWVEWWYSLIFKLENWFEDYLTKNHFDLVVEHIPWIDPVAWKIHENEEMERLASSLQG